LKAEGGRKLHEAGSPGQGLMINGVFALWGKMVMQKFFVIWGKL
jgi:hypothetical protein